MTQQNPIGELLIQLQKWQESVPSNEKDMMSLSTSMILTHLTASSMWMTQLEQIGMMLLSANPNDIDAIKQRMTNIANDVQNAQTMLSNEIDKRVPPRLGARDTDGDLGIDR